MLTSVPSIIYGLFGQAYLTKIAMNISGVFGIQTLGWQSVITTALVLGMMIILTITMVSINSIQAVKNELILGFLILWDLLTYNPYLIEPFNEKKHIEYLLRKIKSNKC